jgi:microcystin-dependent protein
MFSPMAISMAGQSQAHENRQPFLALNFQICNDGIYPTRP